VGTAVPAAVQALLDQLGRVVYGNPQPLQLTVAAFLASGHVLLEDQPGVGKTLLAKALAGSLGGSFGRVQGTPDLLPSDVTGVSIYEEDTRAWRFQPGPLFHQVVLVDELNRATPRTQSALLEGMAEQQVSIDGTTHALPSPFFVIATQNPQDDVGTFPLVAGQRDRFTVSVSMGLPGREAERLLVRGYGGEHALAEIRPVADGATWEALRGELEERIYLHDAVAEYALDLLDTARHRLGGTVGLSTRAALALLRVARGLAVVRGRDFVAPDDVQAVAPACIAHRIVDATNDHLPSARHWVIELLHQVPVPPGVTGARG
jgi:MoxR-like ATPase